MNAQEVVLTKSRTMRDRYAEHAEALDSVKSLAMLGAA